MDELTEAVQALGEYNRFDQISVIAPLILSGIAILISIGIARKQTKISMKQAEIAEQQNKIALFEKRFKFYDTLRRCAYFLSYDSNETEPSYFQNRLLVAFDKATKKDWLPKELSSDANEQFMCIYEILQQAEFLFDFEISSTAGRCIGVINFLISQGIENQEKNKEYFTLMSKIYEITLPQIKEVLKFSKDSTTEKVK